MRILIVLLTVLINTYMLSLSAFRRPVILKLIRSVRRNSVRELLSSSAPQPQFQKHGESKHYDFAKIESSLYSWWHDNGFFAPKEAKEKYVIPMPPPNVTGYLHMGHAIFIALQDIIVRFKRMRGFETLWVPGTDHAGIAGQLVVENHLKASGVSRQSISREKFLEEMWKWKNEKGDGIIEQMKRLGASADWTKQKFTLDPEMNLAVTEAFVCLFEKGLIYRGDYMVNWSPSLQTAVSDLEVDYKEVNGKLYHVKYELVKRTLEEKSEYITIATTRPETILGDTAVCVHPEDSRYAHLVGRRLRVPLTDREIPVIADLSVSPEFGTGALKITPGHDMVDYTIGKRHNLPTIRIIAKDGSITENGGLYSGLDRFECRKRIWKDLEAAGLGVKAEDHMQRIPVSQRGGDVIEPMLSTQWFVRMEGMAQKAVEAVEKKQLTLLPDRYEAVWYEWLGKNNIRDWCISRQLWWGHRIPVYYIISPDGTCSDGSQFVVARTPEEAQQKAVAQFGPGVSVVQDEDVLDTWFSSGLWPFASMGWPRPSNADLDTSSDLAKYYPAHLLETGYDILFFWVARMVMLGLELTEKLPFDTVYLHGLVRDAQGQKMSKTKGNVIDPIDTVNEIGCDALRLSLVIGSTPGMDQSLSTEKLESNKHFVNKLWNIGKYISSCVSSVHLAESTKLSDLQSLALSERFIISKCHQLTADVTMSLNTYKFSEAGKLIYDFLWFEFADWFVESSKCKLFSSNPVDKISSTRVLVYVWETCLRLLHPFMPFVTESLWQLIPHEGVSIMLAEWPQMNDRTIPTDDEAVEAFEQLKALVVALRNARSVNAVEPSAKIEVILKPKNLSSLQLLSAESNVICRLAGLSSEKFRILSADDVIEMSPDSYIHVVVDDALEAFIPQKDLLNVEKETLRLSKQRAALLEAIVKNRAKLESPGFAEKAPTKVVDGVRKNLREAEDELLTVEKSLEKFNKI